MDLGPVRQGPIRRRARGWKQKTLQCAVIQFRRERPGQAGGSGPLKILVNAVKIAPPPSVVSVPEAVVDVARRVPGVLDTKMSPPFAVRVTFISTFARYESSPTIVAVVLLALNSAAA